MWLTWLYDMPAQIPMPTPTTMNTHPMPCSHACGFTWSRIRRKITPTGKRITMVLLIKTAWIVPSQPPESSMKSPFFLVLRITHSPVDLSFVCDTSAAVLTEAFVMSIVKWPCMTCRRRGTPLASDRSLLSAGPRAYIKGCAALERSSLGKSKCPGHS